MHRMTPDPDSQRPTAANEAGSFSEAPGRHCAARSHWRRTHTAMTEQPTPTGATGTLPPPSAAGFTRSPPAPQAAGRTPLQIRLTGTRTTLIAAVAALTVVVI